MYNKDRKLWYLSDCGYEKQTQDLLTSIFNSIELAEEVIGKDISEFTDDEAIDYLKSLNSRSRRRLKVYAWYLSRYHDWCYNKGIITNINPFDDTIDKVIETIIPINVISEQIITEESFREAIDIEPDYISKFIAICCYYGIKGDEYSDMVNLKMEDLDEENKTVKLLSGRSAPVDDYFIEHMKKANETDTYMKLTEDNNKNYKQLIYVESPYVIRCTAGFGDMNDSNPAKISLINARIGRLRKNVGNQYFTTSNLAKSGLINYLKKKYEAQGISLKTALLEKDLTKKTRRNECTLYDVQTQKYIDEFGSKKTSRLLRMQIKDFIEYFNDIDSNTELTIDDINNNEEGKLKYYLSKRFERNPENRKNAIKIHGTKCKCCEFDFEKTYGEIGIGFIEIHHKKPLYTLDKEIEVNPEEDLVPVCSNCHRIIHKNRDKVLTVEEVSELVKINKIRNK